MRLSFGSRDSNWTVKCCTGLRSRGICAEQSEGLLSRSAATELIRSFQKICDNYPCVVAGVRTCDPALSFACVDHHDLAYKLLQMFCTLGIGDQLFKEPRQLRSIQAVYRGCFAGLFVSSRSDTWFILAWNASYKAWRSVGLKMFP